MGKKLIISMVAALLLASTPSLSAESGGLYPDVTGGALINDLKLLTDLNIVEGYPDGTFKPLNTINRAELLKMVLRSSVADGDLEKFRYEDCFSDVPSNMWYTSAICYGRSKNIISGYPGTSEFRPTNTVNAVEALKIIFNTQEIKYQTVISPWYEGLLIISSQNYSYNPSPDHEITRGEVVTLLAEIIREKQNEGSIINSSQPNPTPIPQPPLEKNLQEIFETRPTDEEIAQIMRDFEINYIDSEDEKWPEEFTFDQNSTEPSKMVIISHLNVLRQQEFSEPLPFTEGLSIYDYVKNHTKKFSLDLECRFPGASLRNISLDRRGGLWDLRGEDCKIPFENHEVTPYTSKLQLIVHENEHNNPNDVRHDECLNWAGDYSFEGGSGYAKGAIYSMWVYKYGLYDPEEEKQYAKYLAKGLLQSSFCTKPTHSDPRVQSIIDELVAEIKAEGGSVIGY